MATLNTLGVDSLSLRGAGTEYNSLSRVFKTKAEADAALASGDWTPVAGRMNLCVTGDQGVLRVDENGALVTADDATRAYIDAQVQAVVGDAPAVLDSLGELSDAMSDDPNFFATMASANTTLQEAINTEVSRATAAETAIQADVDANETAANTAIAAEETRATTAEAAIQADVDQNEADADAAIAAENTRAVAAEAAIQADVDANEASQNADIAAEAARAGAAEAAIQADVDQNEADADAAIAAVQADVDQNEADADTAIAAEETRATAAEAAIQADVDQNEADADAAVAAENAAMLSAVAAVQADVDQNESDADTAIAAENAAMLAAVAVVQADVDQNESDADAAIAAVQADVDQNESDSDAAIAAERARIDAILVGAGASTDNFAEIVALVNSVDTANDTAFAGYVTSNDAAVAAVQADVDQNETDADAAIAAVQADVDANEVDRRAVVDIQSNITSVKNAVRGTSIEIGNNIAIHPASGGRVEIEGDLLLDNQTDVIDGAGVTLTSFTNINAYDGRLNTLEADPTTATAVAAVQSDVDANEAAALAARNAIQADVDQNEADADSAIAAEESARLAGDASEASARQAADSTLQANINAVQADVDQNETDGDAADSALSGRLDTLEADPVTKAYVDGTTTTEALTRQAQDTTLQGNIDAVQADVDQNEADADAAIAAVQADVDQNEADADAAIAAVQADVDQNESDSDAAIAVERGRIDAILAGADADKDTFSEIVTLINSVDTTNDNAFAGYVTSNDAAVAAVQADVDQNESDADAAIAAVQADVDQNEADSDAADAALGVRIDSVESEIDTARTNIYTALGTAAESATTMGTFTGSTLSDNTTVRALLQELETDTESRLSQAGGQLTGNLTLRKSDGSAVALELSRADHADMNVVWKVQPSYVSADKEVLTVLANGQVVAHFDERQRFAINMNDPDYTLDVGGDGHFSTNLVVGGTLTLGSTAITATAAELNYVDGVTSNVQTQLDAIQADVDQNESDADAAIAAVQADVDQNESDADAAIAAVQADVDQNESDADAAIAAVQADVDQNEADADAAIAANETHIDNAVTLTGVAKDSTHLATFTGSTITDNQTIKAALQLLETKVEAVQTDVDGNESDADTAIGLKLDASAVSTFGGTLVDDADAAAARTTLGLGTVATTAASAYATAAQGTTADAALPASGAQAALHVDHIITLSGVAQAADDLGTFSGSTISDNVTIKAALQSLETAQETTQADVDQNESDADAAIAAVLAGTSIPGPYNNDSDAATGGVAVGAIYKNSNGTIHWRVS